MWFLVRTKSLAIIRTAACEGGREGGGGREGEREGGRREGGR